MRQVFTALYASTIRRLHLKQALRANQLLTDLLTEATLAGEQVMIEFSKIHGGEVF